jgi:hypothetical protein
VDWLLDFDFLDDRWGWGDGFHDGWSWGILDIWSSNKSTISDSHEGQEHANLEKKLDTKNSKIPQKFLL